MNACSTKELLLFMSDFTKLHKKLLLVLSLIWHRLGYLIVDNTLFVNHQPKIKNCLFELFSFIKINAMEI